MKELLQKRWVKTAGLVLLCIGAVYALIYADVVLRARSAYLEGEKYWSWHSNPQEKAKALESAFAEEKAALDTQLAKGKLKKEEHGQQLEIAQFNRDQKLKESSIKYAYIWYQTVVELFSPPESKWVRLAREKMPQAKELWKQELKAKNIPFEDYMLE